MGSPAIHKFPSLPLDFYLRDTRRVARELLGKKFVRILYGICLSGIIVETEAYCTSDPASHSFRGRSNRNDVMFWSGGHLYVYFTYGMHFCANVVTREEGIGEAVLIRAIEPMEGIELMMKNRGIVEEMKQRARVGESKSVRKYGSEKLSVRAYEGKKQLFNVTNGPAKLCQALVISREENGINLLGNQITITEVEHPVKFAIGTSSRVGIRRGQENHWRYYIKGNPWVSR